MENVRYNLKQHYLERYLHLLVFVRMCPTHFDIILTWINYTQLGLHIVFHTTFTLRMEKKAR